MKEQEESAIRDVFVRRCCRLFSLMEAQAPPVVVGYEVALIVSVAKLIPGVREAFVTRSAELELERGLAYREIDPTSDSMMWGDLPSKKAEPAKAAKFLESVFDLPEDMDEDEKVERLTSATHEFIKSDEVLSLLASGSIKDAVDWFGGDE